MVYNMLSTNRMNENLRRMEEVRLRDYYTITSDKMYTPVIEEQTPR